MFLSRLAPLFQGDLDQISRADLSCSEQLETKEMGGEEKSSPISLAGNLSPVASIHERSKKRENRAKSSQNSDEMMLNDGEPFNPKF